MAAAGMLRLPAMPQRQQNYSNYHNTNIPPPPRLQAPPLMSQRDGSLSSSSSAPRSEAGRWSGGADALHRQGGEQGATTSRSSMQYARPLQRTHSYPPHGSPKDEKTTPACSSEHMLRRKTPNGILNAAYDGTAVEQIERPHAMKHILLPVSDQVTEAVPHGGGGESGMGLRPHAQAFDPGYAPSINYANPSSNPNHGSTWPRPKLQHSLPWIPNQQTQLPQIDSMLNQVPPLQSPGMQNYMAPGHHPYAFMPPVQLAYGPTASNDSGPFGPYWPNGTFVPYRPAALQDPRYHPQHNASWGAHGMQMDQAVGNGLWANAGGNPYLDMSGLNLNNQQQPFLGRSLNAQLGIPTSLGNGFYSGEAKQHDAVAYDGRRQENSIFSQVRPQLQSYDSGLESGQTTPTPKNYHSLRPLSDYGTDMSK